jgi:hypothetical protein
MKPVLERHSTDAPKNHNLKDAIDLMKRRLVNHVSDVERSSLDRPAYSRLVASSAGTACAGSSLSCA